MKKHITLGIWRGFIWQIIGTVLGIGYCNGRPCFGRFARLES